MIKYNDLIHKLIDIQRSESYCSRAFRNDTTRKEGGGGGVENPPFFKFEGEISIFRHHKQFPDTAKQNR